MIAAFCASWAVAASLDELVARGEVLVVETKDDGRLQQVTTYSHVDAPVETVWAKLVAFEAYSEWMPQVARSEVTARTDASVEVAWSIKVPGPNATFTAKYDL